ncbi:MAG: alpha-L-fucosidase, partial [Planctomycetota bacterium]
MFIGYFLKKSALWLILFSLTASLTVAEIQQYQAEWESFKQYEVPQWYLDAKFGIFIHWGVYSVPAYGNEWYPRRMYRKEDSAFEHHIKTYGPQAKFGYKDFIPSFKAEKWDPDAWTELFDKAGARYVVPVAEHHDGFAMYDSDVTHWNSVMMGPKRDIVGELAASLRKRGIKVGASSHRAFNWDYYTFSEDFDTSIEENWGLYGKPHHTGQPASKEFLDD